MSARMRVEELLLEQSIEQCSKPPDPFPILTADTKSVSLSFLHTRTQLIPVNPYEGHQHNTSFSP
jgi:hypothetical protein